MTTQHRDKPGSGVLYTNENKNGNPKAPHFKGHILLSRDYKAGDKIFISSWSYQTGKGQLLSLAEDTYAANQQTQYPKEVNRRDDEVPF